MCVIRRLSFDNKQSLGKSGKANELVRSCSTDSISSDDGVVVDTNVPTKTGFTGQQAKIINEHKMKDKQWRFVNRRL